MDDNTQIQEILKMWREWHNLYPKLTIDNFFDEVEIERFIMEHTLCRNCQHRMKFNGRKYLCDKAELENPLLKVQHMIYENTKEDIVYVIQCKLYNADDIDLEETH